jgi:hypothetical protein
MTQGRRSREGWLRWRSQPPTTPPRRSGSQSPRAGPEADRDRQATALTRGGGGAHGGTNEQQDVLAKLRHTWFLCRNNSFRFSRVPQRVAEKLVIWPMKKSSNTERDNSRACPPPPPHTQSLTPEPLQSAMQLKCVRESPLSFDSQAHHVSASLQGAKLRAMAQHHRQVRKLVVVHLQLGQELELANLLESKINAVRWTRGVTGVHAALKWRRQPLMQQRNAWHQSCGVPGLG